MANKKQMRAFMIRIPVEVDDKMRELRRRGYLPAALARQALERMVKEKLSESERRAND